MPKGSHVDKVYEALKGRGYDSGKAARIAQSQTGDSLKTGKPAKKAAFDPDMVDPDYGHMDRRHARTVNPPDMGLGVHEKGAEGLRKTLEHFRKPNISEE
jgi:hypothetical protein